MHQLYASWAHTHTFTFTSEIKLFTGVSYRISTGVPEGSILGLLLFIIYIDDLCNASKLFKMIIYADDTTLYFILDDFGNYISKYLNLELTKVADWLRLNKLSINIKKSKFVLFFNMPQKQFNIP